MEFKDFNQASVEFYPEPPKDRSKTPERITYEAEVDVIKSQIGDLEDIRERLGLSARKMAQLLMVDPSAWTRWTKKITPPPPHIFRALQWYLIIHEKNPAFTPQVFLSHRWHSKRQFEAKETQDFQQQIELLQNKIQKIENHQSHQLSRLHLFWLAIALFMGGLLLGSLSSYLIKFWYSP